jgi:hypothetical protein
MIRENWGLSKYWYKLTNISQEIEAKDGGVEKTIH